MTTIQTINRTRNSTLIRLALAAGIAWLGASFDGGAAVWTGAAPTGSQLWSEPANWDTFQAPAARDPVTLTNGGSTNVIGAVNSIISANTTITNLMYRAKVSFVSLVTNYHTTLINPGVALTIDQGTGGGGLLYVGDWDPLSQDNQYYYTVKGPAATLTAGNISVPATNPKGCIAAERAGRERQNGK